MNAEVLLVVITNPGCPDLRLPEWISRRREQHRNCRLDTRPVSQTRCPVGCGLQFSRRLFSRYQSSSNDRQRHDPFGRCESVRRDRWIIRRDYLGPSDMWWGLPTSSSHALIGGYAGAAMMHAALHTGWRSSLGVIISSGWYKTLLFIVVAPVLGMVLGLVFMTSVYRIFQRRPPRQIDKWFRKAQLFSAACYSLGHGGNDAQKTMGVVAGALYRWVHEQGGRARYVGTLPLAHHPGGARGNCGGDLLWRMENCAHHGTEDHQAQAGRRVLRRKRRCTDFVWDSVGWHPRFDDARDHRSYRWRRGGTSLLSGPLGSGTPHRLGLDRDDSSIGVDGWSDLWLVRAFAEQA